MKNSTFRTRQGNKSIYKISGEKQYVDEQIDQLKNEFYAGPGGYWVEVSRNTVNYAEVTVI